MANHEQMDAELNQMILRGQLMEGFEKFYADGVVMQENLAPEIRGKDACRQHEMEFFSKVQEFHGAKLLGSAAQGDLSYSEWEFDVTFKGAPRMKLTQVAARRWKGGQLVHERFYYDAAH